MRVHESLLRRRDAASASASGAAAQPQPLGLHADAAGGASRRLPRRDAGRRQRLRGGARLRVRPLRRRGRELRARALDAPGPGTSATLSRVARRSAAYWVKSMREK